MRIAIHPVNPEPRLIEKAVEVLRTGGIVIYTTDTVYGIGAGIFFIGYFFFEVPSNVALKKFGARMWIARIMISWGIVSACMIFVKGAMSARIFCAALWKRDFFRE